ncbi:NAD-glutamate dehydrogenase domain-containing protein [Sulfurimonas sp. HSL1-6]|uniref:NAD-glutamate dehydrogenase domain-containing protein n=1 Tax=Thiomicrolovo immobilis TaxID=3131935 RepID=UPI0031F7427D
MSPESQLGAVCSQLLNPQDLEIGEELLTALRQTSIVTQITLAEGKAAVRLYSREQLLLSDITPILHDFAFVVVDEVTYTVEPEEKPVHVCRFNLQVDDTEAFSRAKTNIESVITDSLLGRTFSSCRIYSLVYKQNLSLRQVTLLRAFIEYINQAVPSINFDTILHTVTRHDELSAMLLHYFAARFNPELKARAQKSTEIEGIVAEAIKAVPDIMDDRILKLLFAMLGAMSRTNYYLEREAIAFKLDMTKFAEHLRGIQPRIEAFVYHKDFRGLHLRMGRISRGGLRWSERYDDYRTEVRSLMVTQEGKNAIIIPDGAKGGFVIDRPRSEITKELFTAIYSAFIENLLDLVDNVENGETVHDSRIVAYDGEDSYFVVAADKGTAAMSDTANAIALKRGFWLGDAFASGGSNGYDHKAIGITAKGAMRSTQRFFLERGIDLYNDPISVVGIGSMNGDVFGNGVLLSRAFKLLGAISHREIFVDPNPSPQEAFEERKRLFAAKDGSWGAYKKELISSGGGVWERSEKAIALSDEIRRMLQTQARYMSGEELARALLCMKVDLLFNGGVGTYVKHSEESDLELGDKQNESVRVNAAQLRCFAVCEGGNLGFTQRARIEYALGGGKINLDGIDNAGGVDTSDHEVNIKILLESLSRKGLLDQQSRAEVLGRHSEQVENSVLWSCYRQALTISRDEQLSRMYLEDFQEAIDVIAEENPVFNRRDFYIPKKENIFEVLSAEDGGIVRPILGSLLSYAKIFIKQLIIDTPLIDEQFAQRFLYKYFPKAFVSAYEEEIRHHPLRPQIIATMIADMVINDQGVSFVRDYRRLGKARFLMKIRAYLICNALFGANDIRHTIFRSDYTMPVRQQYALLDQIEHVLNFATRWMVKYVDVESIDSLHFIEHKEELFEMLSKIKPKQPRMLIEGDDTFNRFFDVLEYLRFAVAVIITKEQSKHSFSDVATLFYLVIERFAILRIINILNAFDLKDERDLNLRRQLLQFVEYIAVHYTNRILAFQRINEPPMEAFENFLANDQEAFADILESITALEANPKPSLRDVTLLVNLLMTSVI